MYIVLIRWDDYKDKKDGKLIEGTLEVLGAFPEKRFANRFLEEIVNQRCNGKGFMLSTEEYAKLQNGMKTINDIETVLKL